MANISTIKNELSKYLRFVQKGETVRILDRDQPVADLVPVGSGSGLRGDYLVSKLEARGIVRRGTGTIPAEILAPRKTESRGAGVLDTLLKERKEGR